ncbi:hypothetical protein ccrud_01740 [Corynebacterium crudilactis]|uniref:DUF4230 domain-containing protein n=2 Tax=Corynebacterium crudilactis TaxID=1652495 RepID=A0A172QQV5_9CORY|nr:hypothetical protein ccrud_01740 [Corynebacterium crudilactis]
MLRNRLFFMLFALVALIGLITGLIVLMVNSQSDEEASSSTRTTVNNTMVIKALQREEEIVLLSAGAIGIHEESIERTIRGKRIPGTQKTVHIQYGYTGKLGIDASDVEIKSSGDNRFSITIPEFIFIGYDDLKFKTLAEDAGWISFSTEDIDTAAVVTEIMSPENFIAQIDTNREILEDQAANFYNDLLNEFTEKLDEELYDDTKIELDFEFE